MNIIFMGTSEFAVPTLQALIESHHTLLAVYTQPPKVAGRGTQFNFSPVYRLAQKYHLHIETPTTLKDHTLEACDVVIVVAYGHILPSTLLKQPRFGCFNLHASLLPRWRGAAPIARAIEAGDTHTGVCVMRMTPGLDEGPIIACEQVSITPVMTTDALTTQLAHIGTHLIMTTIQNLDHGIPLTQLEQNTQLATYAAKITNNEGHINWHHAASIVDAKIRAMTPHPGAFTIYPNHRSAHVRLKILQATPITFPHHKEPGTVFLQNKDFIVACACEALSIKTVQKQGKSPMPARAFLNGAPEIYDGLQLL